MPDLVLKRQILLQPIVYYEIAYRIIREFYLETHSAFLDHVKNFGRVKREILFEILQSKNIRNLLLKSIIEIYSGTKIKEKLNNQLPEKVQLITKS